MSIPREAASAGGEKKNTNAATVGRKLEKIEKPIRVGGCSIMLPQGKGVLGEQKINKWHRVQRHAAKYLCHSLHTKIFVFPRLYSIFCFPCLWDAILGKTTPERVLNTSNAMTPLSPALIKLKGIIAGSSIAITVSIG